MLILAIWLKIPSSCSSPDQMLIVPQHEAALREIVELRRRLNEFQANALTQNHLHSVSAFEMKAKVSEFVTLIV